MSDAPAATSKLLEGLTDEQARAVTTTEGPVLILAGAGSGKTRVLTRRVAYLMEQGVDPSAILAITFTNKAAGEMRERVMELTGRRGRDFGRLHHDNPTLCTFHSLCLRILRHYGTELGVPDRFSIYDTSDQKAVVKQVLKELDVSSTNFPPGNILGSISNAKNALQTADVFASQATDFYQRTVAKAYLKYEKTLQQNEALDFDDLILRTVLGLRDQPRVLKELQEHFQYLHIDEYQDTNRAQYLLAHVMADRHKNLCVVGDPDQSIYAWRGADLRNILDFEQDYPKAAVVRLERNYRSTAAILEIADELIAKNTQRKDKKLVPHIEGGDKAALYLCQDENDEARRIAERLKEFHGDGYEWSDMAVFYRMNALSRVMEMALRSANVPYQIARGTEFYNRKEIKDILAYLRSIASPRDEVSLKRIINTPTRGIGNTTIAAVESFAAAKSLPLWEALVRVDEIETISARAKGSIGKFVKLVEAWRELANVQVTADEAGESPGDLGMFGDIEPGDDMVSMGSGPVTPVVEAVVQQSGLEAHYKKIGGDEQAELLNLSEFITAASQYDEDQGGSDNPLDDDAFGLGDFLNTIALVSDTDRMDEAGGAVTLMTLHAAKGLEFPVVAMIGLEEGCLPHSRARDDEAQLEEERRLAFVGITRAQRKLLISSARYRTVRGLRERTVPSPFLGEISEDKFDIHDHTTFAGFEETRDYQRAAMSTGGDRLAGKFSVGQRLKHPAFGAGTVLDLTGGSKAKIVISFDKVGQKTLMLEYAGDKLSPA